MRKLFIPLIVTLILGFSIFIRISTLRGENGVSREGIENIQRREGFPVKLATVQQGPFEVWRAIHGKVQGYKEAYISTPDAARVAIIRHTIGDRVASETPIISLDENDPRNMSQAKFLQSVYDNAVKEYERYENLYNSGGVSKDVLDKVQLQLKSAKTNLDSARATVHLTSPFDGILTALYTRVGENAEPNKTLAIVSILDKVRIVTAVSDRDIADFVVGQPVFVAAADGRETSGTVDRISIGANPDSGLFDLELVLENKDRVFRVGMFVNARVRVYRDENATFIDSNTILRDFDGTDYVWTVDKGHARKLTIIQTKNNDTSSQVTGIDPGKQVVVKGKSLLFEEAPLNILDKDTP